MKIIFENLETSTLHNFKGGEKYLTAKMHVDENNKIMKAYLVPGASIGIHAHVDTSEIIFITDGTGKAICDGKEEMLEAGSCHYCPKGSTHTLINTGNENLCFYAVVPNHETNTKN